MYGVSAWDVRLEGARQERLVITPSTFLQGRHEFIRTGESPEEIPETGDITVDDLEVAQFLYTLIHNKNLRKVIDTITTKVVLILGRFTEERKRVLDSIRKELRTYDYIPVLFDFQKPANQDLIDTVTTLSRLSRFIIADITDATMVREELRAIVPDLAVPVQPILKAGGEVYTSFPELRRRYHWVLPVIAYQNENELIANLRDKVKIGRAHV